MKEEHVQAIAWVSAALVLVTLISGIVFYNIDANRLEKELVVEYAKQGLHQKMEFTGNGTRVIWVKQ